MGYETVGESIALEFLPYLVGHAEHAEFGLPCTQIGCECRAFHLYIFDVRCALHPQAAFVESSAGPHNGLVDIMGKPRNHRLHLNLDHLGDFNLGFVHLDIEKCTAEFRYARVALTDMHGVLMSGLGILDGAMLCHGAVGEVVLCGKSVGDVLIERRHHEVAGLARRLKTFVG